MRLHNLIPSSREFQNSLGILAVLMRVLVAPGFMPDLNAAAAGDFKLVICSAGAPKTISVDAEGGATARSIEAPAEGQDDHDLEEPAPGVKLLEKTGGH